MRKTGEIVKNILRFMAVWVLVFNSLVHPLFHAASQKTSSFNTESGQFPLKNLQQNKAHNGISEFDDCILCALSHQHAVTADSGIDVPKNIPEEHPAQYEQILISSCVSLQNARAPPSL